MASRRWLLIALSLSSLVILSYAGVAVAFSVTVTPEMAAANTVDGVGPRVGYRAIIGSVVSAGDVITVAEDPQNASMLLVADRRAAVPAAAEGTALVRALAFASVRHDGTYTTPTFRFENLTSAEGPYNATVNVSELGNGRSGFLVKPDASRELRFVPETQVVGVVTTFETSVWVFGMVVVGALGFVIPLVALIFTARPAPRAPRIGVPGAACPECRRPLAADADFCTACGAWIPGKG